MQIIYDNSRAYDVLISPQEQSDVSPMISQDNLEFLIKRGFRISNIWSECKKGLRMSLIQVHK